MKGDQERAEQLAQFDSWFLEEKYQKTWKALEEEVRERTEEDSDDEDARLEFPDEPVAQPSATSTAAQKMLQSLMYGRLAVDEGHTQSKKETRQYMALKTISNRTATRSTWILTGTPITSTLIDFHVQVSVVDAPLLEDEYWYRRHVEGESLVLVLTGAPHPDPILKGWRKRQRSSGP